MNRLMKCESDKIICGVCSGVARYFNIDPTAVRVGWAILSLISAGLGVIGYIAAALIMPSDNGQS